MNRTLRTLGWLAAVIQEDPEPWFTTDPDTDYVPYVNSFSFESLSLVPDALMLLKRSLHLAMEQQDLPVKDLQEALRHVLVFKFHFREEWELELAWDSERTRSAVETIEYTKDALAEEYQDYKYAFLPELVFQESRGIFEFELEGYTLKVGRGTLSVPWEMVATGYIPASLQNFGELLDADTRDLDADPLLKPRELIFEIHDSEGFDPWIRRETFDFMMGIAAEVGWFHSLHPSLNNILVFDLVSRMPGFHIENNFHPHPPNTSWAKLQKIARVVEESEIHSFNMDVLEARYQRFQKLLSPTPVEEPSESST